MIKAELDRQIAEVLEKGFDESFTAFCAKTFSSYNYPPENLAPARMHAFSLKVAMGMVLGDTLDEDIPFMNVCRQVAEESCRSALETDRPFCEIFVENWCAYYSKPAKSFKG